MRFPIQRLHRDAVVPEHAYAGDAGLDLAICEPVSLVPGERAAVRTGLAVEIPAGYAGFVLPRSGLALNHGVTLVNSPGLIDSGYRGEIKLIVINTDRNATFTADAGERMAQLVIVAYPSIEPYCVDELEGSARGERGFGSSTG